MSLGGDDSFRHGVARLFEILHNDSEENFHGLKKFFILGDLIYYEIRGDRASFF